VGGEAPASGTAPGFPRRAGANRSPQKSKDGTYEDVAFAEYSESSNSDASGQTSSSAESGDPRKIKSGTPTLAPIPSDQRADRPWAGGGGQSMPTLTFGSTNSWLQAGGSTSQSSQLFSRFKASANASSAASASSTGYLGDGDKPQGSVAVSAAVERLLAQLTEDCRPKVLAIILDNQQELQLDLGEFWSKGSELHSSGNCKPCFYVNMKGGCGSGQDCLFCHIPHVAKTGARPCKAKRVQIRRFSDLLGGLTKSDDESFRLAVQKLAGQNARFQELLQEHSEALIEVARCAAAAETQPAESSPSTTAATSGLSGPSSGPSRSSGKHILHL